MLTVVFLHVVSIWALAVRIPFRIIQFISKLRYLGPAPLQGPYDSTGFPVGCKSACVCFSNDSLLRCNSLSTGCEPGRRPFKLCELLYW